MILDNKPKVRFTWNMLYECNYRCSYCFFEGKWEEYKSRNNYLSVDEWIKYWKRVYDRYGPIYLVITGGEPFMYPDFIELIQRLSPYCYHINISTNSSGNLAEFVKKNNPEKVSLSLSFQPEFDKLDDFIERLSLIRKHGFNGCINFVAYPPQLKDIDSLRQKFRSAGEDLKVIPFWGEYEGRKYPESYTDQEKELVGINGEWLSHVRKKGIMCEAGSKSALLFPDGKVARCGQIGEDLLIGNFTDPGFKLFDKPLPCDAEYCPCDEGKIPIEEDVKVKPSREELISERQRNIQLNDKEYNERKVVLESTPKSIFIQAANHCNASCVFCSRGRDYEIFDLDIYRQRFEKKLSPVFLKAESIIYTGSGEFLQLPEAGKILDYFDGNFPHVDKMFSTNGSSLVPWVAEKIVASPSQYAIHVSLHSSNPDLHKTLTRMDNFHKIVGQVNNILKLRKESGKNSPTVKLIFVATTLNVEDLPNFVRLAHQLGVDGIICYYNYIYVPAQKYLSCFFKQELTNRIRSEAEDLASRLKVNLSLSPKFGQKAHSSPPVCREPFSQIMFTSEGHVLPCDAAEDCRERLENVQDFMEIWNSEYYQRLRRSVIDGSASCFNHCLRANPAMVNDFKSHVIHRGNEREIDLSWGDNF